VLINAVLNAIPIFYLSFLKMPARIGDGGTTSFWLTCWLGDVPLSELSPRLFSLSIHKNDMIDNFYERIRVGVNWYFSWRRPLFQWESVLVLDLIVFLYGTGIS
jgi:hypothetical protein